MQLVTRSKKSKEKGKRWQRLTLPRSHPRSTISAHELNFRVRDGAGWTLTAGATNTCPFFPALLSGFILMASSHHQTISSADIPTALTLGVFSLTLTRSLAQEHPPPRITWVTALDH